MEYTIQKLGQLAGVSTRTLRYYDEIGILKPARINSSGYRIYGQKEIDLLQQILFYRALEVDLETIKKIMTAPEFDGIRALNEHHDRLLEKRKQLDRLVENVEKTIASTEGRIKMSNQEKFEGFKKRIVEDNEKKYGEEVRTKYGNEAADNSNQRVLNMTQEEYEKAEMLAAEIETTLAEALGTGDPASEKAQKAVDLHRQWLCLYWDEYSKEAHAGLGNMYVEDERFKAYYDKAQPGTAEFLRDAILVYTGLNK
ncbi:MAG: MerR family transcriptional regulator [Eubacteriales bacterium]|nr:MerR family transcriptional regulator [Eubacteriales bacterium]